MKFSGVTILQGVKFSIFLLIFEWALQQCSATALPVIHTMFHLVMKNIRASIDSRIYPAQSMAQQPCDGLPAIFSAAG